MTWTIRNGPMVRPKSKAMRNLSRGWRGFWKVTAMYDVCVTSKTVLPIVRVTACGTANSTTLHLSHRELRRLFHVSQMLEAA